MKKFLIIAFIVLFILAPILNNYRDLKVILNPEKGTFEEIIFSEKEFDSICISNRDTLNRKETEDKEIINELIEYIKDINLIQKLKFDSKNPVPDKTYSIDFYNNKTKESVDIYFLDEEYVRIWTSVEVKVVDEKTKSTGWETEHDYKIYKIDGTKVDIDYIEKIFNKIEDN